MKANRSRQMAALIGLPVGLLLGAAPAVAQAAPVSAATPAPSDNAMINLVRLLVAQGTIEEIRAMRRASGVPRTLMAPRFTRRRGWTLSPRSPTASSICA